jgi:hypothetical protein
MNCSITHPATSLNLAGRDYGARLFLGFRAESACDCHNAVSACNNRAMPRVCQGLYVWCCIAISIDIRYVCGHRVGAGLLFYAHHVVCSLHCAALPGAPVQSLWLLLVGRMRSLQLSFQADLHMAM